MNKFNMVIYGFDINNLPINLFIRTNNSDPTENGIGLDIDNQTEINSTNYVQIDLGDYIRIKHVKCNMPLIKIGSIQINKSFIIYGSNQLGQLGTQLYTYTNTISNDESLEIIIPSFNNIDYTSSGDIYKYGPIPFRYISIIAGSNNVVLNTLTFYI